MRHDLNQPGCQLTKTMTEFEQLAKSALSTLNRGPACRPHTAMTIWHPKAAEQAGAAELVFAATAQVRDVHALAQARKVRPSHAGCCCFAFEHTYCNALDALWSRATDRELDLIKKPILTPVTRKKNMPDPEVNPLEAVIDLIVDRVIERIEERAQQKREAARAEKTV